VAAASGHVDELIEPAVTRERLIAAFASLAAAEADLGCSAS